VAELTGALLETRSLVKAFGGVRAVDHVDFVVHTGEIVSVIGPNGSGKTTLFNLITGVYRCDQGSVWLSGTEITGLPAHRITLLGVSRTFQTIRLFDNLTVMDNVLIGAHRAVRASLWEALVRPPGLRQREAAARAKAREVLAIFGSRLLPRSDQPAFSLSYANRRRLEIARALAAEPRVLLLDEPTAGMNPAETAELIGQIQEVRARRCAVVLIEHKLNVVNRISDRVFVLDHGAKIAEGTPEEVRGNELVIEAYLGHPTPAP
jgi:ABC-type branched-subunit amino acid transport system ATPase component